MFRDRLGDGGEGRSCEGCEGNIVEAQNAYGELFGFERIEQMLRDQTSTEEIATAAQEFGQTDDILVLRVERCAPRKILHAEPQEAYT